jgi:hypothetical protein
MATTTVQVQEAVWRQRVEDQASGPAQTITRAMGAMADATDANVAASARLGVAQEALAARERSLAAIMRVGAEDRARGAITTEQETANNARAAAQVEKARQALAALTGEQNRLATSTEETTQRVTRSTTSLNGFIRAIDPVGAAIRNLSTAEEKLAQFTGLMGDALAEGGAKADAAQRTYDVLASKVAIAAERLNGIKTASASSAESVNVATSSADRLAAAWVNVALGVDGAVAKLNQAKAAAAVDATRSANGAQAAVNNFAGVSDPLGGADYASREADLRSFGEEMDRLRAKYDPLFAASKRYEEALDGIEAARSKGAISSQVAEAAMARETAAFAAMADGSAEAKAAQDKLTASLDGYVQAMNPVLASLDRVRAAEAQLAQAQAQGIANPAQVDAVRQMREAHTQFAAAQNKTGDAAKGVTNSLGLQRYQVQNVAAQFTDLGVQLSSGGGIFLPLIQQGPQAIDAVGGVGKAVEILGKIFTPARLVVLAFVGGIAAMSIAAISQSGELATMETRLKAVSDAYRGTAASALASARAVAASGGVSLADAKAAQRVLPAAAAGAGIAGLDYGALTKQAADFAARMGTDVPAALKTFGDAMRNPVALVDQLASQGFPGMTEGLRLTIQRLVEGGEPGAAFGRVMSVIAGNTADARKEGSSFEQAMSGLGTAWTSFWDQQKGGLADTGEAMIRWFTDVISKSREAREEMGKTSAPQGYDSSGSPRSWLGRWWDGATNGGRNTYATPEAARAGAYEGQSSARLDMIRGVEGGGANSISPYNAVYAGNGGRTQQAFRTMSPGPVTSLTVDQAVDVQSRMLNAGIPNTPIGAYQFTRDTLQDVRTGDGFARGLADQGITGSSILSPDVQNRIAEAIIKSVGDPNSPGYTQRLTARFDGLNRIPRNTLNSTFGIGEAGQQAPGRTSEQPATLIPGITITASRVDLDMPLPANVADTAERRGIESALGTARGADNSPRVSGATPQARGASAAALLPGMLEAQGNAARGFGTAAEVDTLEQSIRGLRQTMAQGEGTEALFIRQKTEAAAAARELDPRMRTVNDAIREYRERMKAAGEVPTPAGEAAAASQALRGLGAAYLQAADEATRSSASQARLTEAWGKGREAVALATAEEKARQVVRASGLEGTAQEQKALGDLTQAYLRLAQQQANNNLLASNDNAQRNLDYLKKEGELIGVSADQRERELAAYKARTEAIASGATDQSAITAAENLARAQVDQRSKNEQLTNSYSELTNVGTQAFDRIGESITKAFADGSLKALNFRDIAKAVFSEVAQAALRMAVVNPLLNSLDGGKRGTLSGLLSVFDSGSGSSGSSSDSSGGTSSGGSSGGILGMVGSLFSGGSNGGTGSSDAGSGMGGALGSVGAVVAAAGAVSSLGGSAASGNSSGQKPTSTTSGLMGYAKQGQQAYSMYGRLNSGMKMFGPGYDWNTNSYIGGFDKFAGTGVGDWLNTPFSIAGAVPTTAAMAQGVGTSMATGYEAASMIGSSGFGGTAAGGLGASQVSGGVAQGLTGGTSVTGTIAGTIGGSVAALGGAYAAYQGFKRGGVGGNIQGVGGVAMAGMGAYAAIAGSMAAIPVAGWIAAAALLIIGALLPGAKPSDKTGTATMNTLDPGTITEGGLNGKKFSQENRTAASDMAKQVRELAVQAGLSTELAGPVDATFRVGVGARDGVTINIGDYQAQGQYNEEGIKAVTAAATLTFLRMAADQTTDKNMASVIRMSKEGGTQEETATTILDNIKFYTSTYRDMVKPLDDVARANGSFANSLKQIIDPIQAASDRAKGLGLDVSVLAKRMADATALATANRNDAFNANMENMQLQLQQGTGQDTSALTIAAFNRERNTGWQTMRAGIVDSGLGDNEIAVAQKLYDAVKDLELKTLGRTITRAQEDRSLAPAQQRTALDIASMGARGNTLSAERAQFEANASASLLALKRQLEDLSFSAEESAARLAGATSDINLARSRMMEDQAYAVSEMTAGLVDRYQAAVGTANDLANQLARLDRQQARERVEFARKEGADLTQLAVTQAAERASLITQQAEADRASSMQSGGNIRAYLDQLKTTPGGNYSPTEQFQNSSLLFERDKTLAATGDADALGRITNTAQSLLDTAGAMYGSSEQFAAVRDYVEASLTNLPATVSYDRQTVELLREANAGDLADRLQLQMIADRAGGEEGGKIVKAAVEAGYGATIAALSQTAGDSAAASWAASESAISNLMASDAVQTQTIIAGVAGGLAPLFGALAASVTTSLDAQAGNLGWTADRSGLTADRAVAIADSSLRIEDVLREIRDQVVALVGIAATLPGWLQAVRDSASRTGDILDAMNGSPSAARSPDSNTMAFAAGGTFTNSIVATPTLFPMAGGRTGLMGEAGPEAIMPLTRAAGGGHGVRFVGVDGREGSLPLTRAASGHLAVRQADTAADGGAYAFGGTFGGVEAFASGAVMMPVQTVDPRERGGSSGQEAPENPETLALLRRIAENLEAARREASGRGDRAQGTSGDMLDALRATEEALGTIAMRTAGAMVNGLR